MRVAVRFLAVAVVGLTLSGCGVFPHTQVAQVDAPYYSSVAELAANSDAAILGRVTAIRTEEEYPTYDSDDPQVNPYAGTGHTPSTEEIKSMGVPVTVSTVTVLAAFTERQLSPGDVVDIVEVGGLGGRSGAKVQGAAPQLGVGGEGLFFVITDDGERYHVLGLSQGRLQRSDNGFVSADPERSDLRLPLQDLSSLAEQVGNKVE